MNKKTYIHQSIDTSIKKIEEESFPTTEEIGKMKDEILKQIDAMREEIDALIACIDDVLLHEDALMHGEII